MNQAQRAILEELRQRHVATSGDLARALDRTPADIRHHLSVLLEEGWVILDADQPCMGRGRRAHRYRLGSRAQVDSFQPLVKAFAETWILPMSAEEQISAIHHLAHNLAEGAVPVSSLTLILNRTMNRLNELGFRARWEARADSPWIFLEYSPYRELAKEIPLLQLLDSALLEALLKRPVHPLLSGKNTEIDIYSIG